MLMAIVDSNSEFLMVDVGANGRTSDGGVFANTKFFQKMQNDELNLPKPYHIIAGQDALPYVFVTEDAFALRKIIMKPFAHASLTWEKMLYNKRLSSARVKVENAFGIVASRFRVLQRTINLQPQKAGILVLACCYLHNFLRRHQRNTYFTSGENIAEFTPLESTVNRNPAVEAKEVRRKFCETIKELNTSFPL